MHLHVRGSRRAFYLLGVQSVLANNSREFKEHKCAIKTVSIYQVNMKYSDSCSLSTEGKGNHHCFSSKMFL